MKIVPIIFFISLSSSAHGALVSRLGGQAVYDTDLDITWLSNANTGAGSIYDDGASGTDGLMTWANANAWAASLTVGGKNNWRLPISDPNCSGFQCTNSEMGHLFYDELGGMQGQSILSSNDPDLLLFSNIGSENYWSATDVLSNPGNAYSFRFNTGVSGSQGAGDKNHELFAWAVHQGDISVVPIPAAVWLFGSGLLGLLGIKHGIR